MAYNNYNSLETVKEETEMDSSRSTTTKIRSSPETYTPKKSTHDHVYLSADRISEIEKYDRRKENVYRGPSKLSVLFKWIFTFFIGSVLTTCTVVSFISITMLCHNLKVSIESDKQVAVVTFVAILLIIMIPYAFVFLRSGWMILGRKDLPWPCMSAIVWCVIASLLESFGMCCVALVTLQTKFAILSVLLMDCVFLLPYLNILLRPNNTIRKKTVYTFSCLMILVGISVTAYTFYKYPNDESVKFIIFSFIGIGCLSFSWMPLVMKKAMIIRIKKEEPESYENVIKTYSYEANFTTSSSNGSSGYVTSTDNLSSNGPDQTSYNSYKESRFYDTYSTDSVSDVQIPDVCIDQGNEFSEKESHWKTLAIASFVKLLTVIPFGLIINEVCSLTDVTDFPAGWDWSFNESEHLFMINVITSFVGYFLAVFSCKTRIEKGGFAVPLMVSPIIVAVILGLNDPCKFVMALYLKDDEFCVLPDDVNWFVVISVVAFCLGRIASLGWSMLDRKSIILEREPKLFFYATFNGVLSGQWFLLNRKIQEEKLNESADQRKRTKIYICTTMFRENRTEMRQLLHSIWAVNIAQKKADNTSGKQFESHIFLDGAVKGGDMQDNALQLVSLLKECLGINHLDDCTKTLTPYGIKLTWKLSIPEENNRHGENKNNGMTFNIHMKDTKKVKNKKRWSQIMYMSYVLDFMFKQNIDEQGNVLDNDDDMFILTTDADVKFKATDVEALMDLMTRDQSVGAVCARTFPLGGGPLVWYQKFEYAIGHWFQKAAEHVLGSVLCAPGCFSVYRCSALRQILPKYSTEVEKAFEFLIKDMGEDRWLCTLMVQSGWRIEYCATSTNETYCPEDFEEFFKQRRRWVASTLANIWKVINEWKYIRGLNHRVSYLFCIYQIFLFVSTIVGPSTVIMVVSGGLAFAWEIDMVTTVLLQIFVCVMFAIICMKMKQSYQMLAGKVLTFAYALIMTAVAVGIAKQVALDFVPPEDVTLPENSTEVIKTTMNPQAINADIPYSVTTLYLGGLVTIFVVTGILHLKEVILLAYGLTYLLCLPSCYLILMIYCICNITDRSWGTREEKADEEPKSGAPTYWHVQLGNILRHIFFCCDKSIATTESDIPSSGRDKLQRSESISSVSGGDTLKRQQSKATLTNSMKLIKEQGNEPDTKDTPSDAQQQLASGNCSTDISSMVKSTDDSYEWLDDGEYDEVIPAHKWLDEEELREKYCKKFEENGYENTLFISMLTAKSLRKVIGVDILAHRNHFLEMVERLPQYKIEIDVPQNVDDWLENIGLAMYKQNFKDTKIVSTKQLETLKSMKEEELRTDLKITKHGHLKRLMAAIDKLRYPTEEERRLKQIKDNLRNAYTHDLCRVNKEEHAFWKALIKNYLEPNSNAFGQLAQLKKDLEKLRFNALVVAGIINCLWLVLALTLAGSADLVTAGTNPLGLTFLIVFGFIFVLQFLCMLVHRLETLSHFIARVPYRWDTTYAASWSFSDDIDPDTEQALKAVKQFERESRRKRREKMKQKKMRTKSSRSEEQEKTPLLASSTGYF